MSHQKACPLSLHWRPCEWAQSGTATERHSLWVLHQVLHQGQESVACWVESSGRVIAFDIGKIEEDFGVGIDVCAHLVVVGPQFAARRGAIGVSGVIDEARAGIIVFQLGRAR